MRFRFALFVAVIALAIPQLAPADPPSHAPAHGYRAKQKQKAPERAPAKPGIEVVYDSERGVHVAVGLTDVFFHDGHYYRLTDGRWEISVSGDGGWRVSVESKVPGAVVEARKKKKSHPGPAKKKRNRR
jgi:hypothetical protein